jgi:hypothetical protein
LNGSSKREVDNQVDGELNNDDGDLDFIIDRQTGKKMSKKKIL